MTGMKMREYYAKNGELRIRTPIGNAVDQELQRQWNYLRSRGEAPVERIVEVASLQDAFPPSVRRPSTARRL